MPTDKESKAEMVERAKKHWSEWFKKNSESWGINMLAAFADQIRQETAREAAAMVDECNWHNSLGRSGLVRAIRQRFGLED